MRITKLKNPTAILLSVAFFLSSASHAQKPGDSKITITVTDTVGLYEKIRIALAKADFIVKDINQTDTITTFPRVLKSTDGSAVANVIIQDHTVIVRGFYSSKRLDYFGFSKTSKDVKPIIYYKNGKLWSLMLKVANGIGEEKQYSK